MRSDYRFVALPAAVAAGVRSTLRSPFGNHPAHVEFATGHGPCRLCLQTFHVGVEQRILFTYDQFAGRESLPLPGPVFIHAGECSRYPEQAGFPPGLISRNLTFAAYGRGRRFVDLAYATGKEIDSTIDHLFARPETDYVHVSDTEAGCYDFRIERNGSAAAD